jgi:L-ribulose-5-phosphate 3-epimerase
MSGRPAALIGPLACSTLAFSGSNLETALGGIAEAGFKHVEIAAMPGYCDHLVRDGEPASQSVQRVRQALEMSGLAPISLSAHIDLVAAPPGHLPALGAAAIDLLLERVRIAAELGAFIVNTQGANPSTDADEALFLARIERVAREAEAAGVAIALEVEDGLTASAESILRLMPRLAGAPIFINFDTGNPPFYSGLDPLTELEPIVRWVRHVHLKDHRGGIGSYDFPAIGEGQLELGSLVRELVRLGYVGPVSAEIEFQHPTARPPVSEIIRAVRLSRDRMESYVDAATLAVGPG